MRTRLRDLVERSVAAACVVVVAPLLLGIAAAIAVDSGRPVFFRQRRVGRGGVPFSMWKFRTMCVLRGETSHALTVSSDKRVTRSGRFLRRTGLDELPQLFNICRGEMSFVGPRPEVPEFVDLSNPAWRAILAAKPGLVDPASLAFRHEPQLLATYSDPVAAYRNVILPHKLTISQRYLGERSRVSDLRQIWRAISLLIGRVKGALE